MNEFGNFLKALSRNKITLIVVPVITVVVTYFLVRNLPDKFISKARIATGLVESNALNSQSKQESEIARDFDNMIQNIKSSKILSLVSYKLILHDLQHRDSAFHDASDDLKKMSVAEKNEAIAIYQDKYEKNEELSSYSAKEKKLINLIGSMGYSEDKISRSLIVYRVSSSDYISLEYESDNPYLSSYALSILSSEFIKHHNLNQRLSNTNTVNYLDSLLKLKFANLTAEMGELKDYKIKNNIFNLYEEAREMYSRIAEMENKKKAAEKDVAAFGAAISDIDTKFDSSNRKYFESSLSPLNLEISSLKEQIRKLSDNYVNSNFDPAIQEKIDSLQERLADKINSVNDKYAYSPLTLKDNLVQQRFSLETDKEMAASSISQYENEVDRLNQRLYNRVPNEAVIQAYEYKIDILGREYIELLRRYNEANIASNFTKPVKLAEAPMPGEALPNKKMLLVILSGIISGTFCVFIIFLLFYFDSSITNAQQLANAIDMPVIGYINLVEDSRMDLAKLWSEEAGGAIQQYKDLLRAVRYEIEHEMKDRKLITITSLLSGEGKTFMTISLAYAFAKINKKVLVIDGNFRNPQISKTVETSFFLEEMMKNGTISEPTGDVTVCRNRGGDYSLLELAEREDIERRLKELHAVYDVILVETASLDALSKAKEWMMFSEMSIAVFEAGKSLKGNQKDNLAYLKEQPNFYGFILNKVIASGSKPKKKNKKSA